MARPPSALPDDLPPVFTVRHAHATGVSVDRLRARDLDGHLVGVRFPVGASHHLRRGAALLACAEAAFLCGPTAAAVHGMPLPPRLHADRRSVIDVGLASPNRAIRRRGVRGRVLRIDESHDLTVVSGLRCLSVARSWCELGAWCSVPELVAAGDWLVRTRSCTTAELSAAVRALPDRRGTAALDVAIGLMDGDAESPKESELRALIVLAGLPKPLVNVVITADGRFIARVDLLFPEFREVLGYQGDHHRTDQRQWRRDRTREAELESHGYHVTEVIADDLERPRELVERIARLLRRQGWNGRLRLSRWFPAAGSDQRSSRR